MKIIARLFIAFSLLILAPIISLVILVNFSGKDFLGLQIDKQLNLAADAHEKMLEGIHGRNVERFAHLTFDHRLEDSFNEYNQTNDRGTLARINESIREVRNHIPGIVEIKIVNNAGDIITSTNQNEIDSHIPLEDIEVSDKLHYRFYESQGNVLGLNILKVIKLSDDSKWTIIVGVDTAEIINLFNDDEELGTTAEIAIVPESNVSRAITLSPLQFIEGDVQKLIEVKDQGSVISELGKSQSYREFIDYKGQRVYATTRFIDGPNWQLIFKVNRDEALKTIYDLQYLIIAFGVLLVILLFVISYYFTRSIAGPISSLNETSKLIADGDLDQRINVSGDYEIAQLASSFNSMVTKLSQSYKDLEDKVRDRTAKLYSKVAELENQQILFKSFLENLPVAVYLIDASSGETVLTNKTGGVVLSQDVDIFGEGEKDPNFHHFLRENGIRYPDHDLPINITLRTGSGSMKDDIIIARHDGLQMAARVSCAPIHNKEGKLTYVVVVVEDITKEKEVEKVKSQFLSVASHELRTPMTAVRGFVSMILQGDYGEVNAGLKEPLTYIGTSTERLIKLVTDMLNIARIESGRLKYSLTEFDINDVVENVVNSLMPTAKETGSSLEFELEGKALVQADQEKVSQILENLIGNSLKFVNRGSISVYIKVRKDRVNVYVSDNGIGISKVDQHKLFGRFAQISSPTEGRPPGSGLGLYISRELARKMGGDLWLKYSEPGKGSIFVFSLPVVGTELAARSKKLINEEAELHPDQIS